MTEGWVFQNRELDRMNTSDVDKGFRQGLRRVQLKEVDLIPKGVEVGEYMSLRRLLRRGSTTDVFNN